MRKKKHKKSLTGHFPNWGHSECSLVFVYPVPTCQNSTIPLERGRVRTLSPQEFVTEREPNTFRNSNLGFWVHEKMESSDFLFLVNLYLQKGENTPMNEAGRHQLKVIEDHEPTP